MLNKYLEMIKSKKSANYKFWIKNIYFSVKRSTILQSNRCGWEYQNAAIFLRCNKKSTIANSKEKITGKTTSL